jgi:hypothetical protein
MARIMPQVEAIVRGLKEQGNRDFFGKSNFVFGA